MQDSIGARAIREYERIRPTYEQFTNRLKELLDTLTDNNEIKIHSNDSRTKTIKSFGDKIHRGGKSYTNPLEEISDLCGIRIIVYYNEDVENVVKLIREEFAVNESQSQDKADELDTQEFGYRSVHLVVTLSEPRNQLAEWSSFKNLQAEIQVRTVLQHSWAAISHALQYKHEDEVPRTLRRRLYRLSGLLELADDEFLSLRHEHDQLTKTVGKSTDEVLNQTKIDRVSVLEFLSRSEIPKLLYTTAESIGYNLIGGISDIFISEITSICDLIGFSTVADLEKALNKVMPMHNKFLSDAFKYRNRNWTVNEGFLFELILILSSAERIDTNFMTNLGWSQDVASSVLKAAHTARK